MVQLMIQKEMKRNQQLHEYLSDQRIGLEGERRRRTLGNPRKGEKHKNGRRTAASVCGVFVCAIE
jgi:hypothetical protein